MLIILPLEGMPLATKDKEDIQGQPNTNGSIILKDHIASKTMSVPSGLSSSNVPNGTQIIARSYSDEFVFQSEYNYEMLDPLINSNENQPSIDL